MTPYQRRVVATEKTKSRFEGRPFKWGRFDCGQMARTHLLNMGRPVKEAAKAGTYHSLKGAIRAVQKTGHSDLIALMDAHFERIPPAAALPGDVVALPGEGGPGALTVALGNGRLLGYHEDVPGAAVLQPNEFIGAWRVDPSIGKG